MKIKIQNQKGESKLKMINITTKPQSNPNQKPYVPINIYNGHKNNKDQWIKFILELIVIIFILACCCKW